MYGLKRIKTYWNRTVRPLARRCSPGYHLVNMVQRAKTRAEHITLEDEYFRRFGDWDWGTTWYIDEMIRLVDHALWNDCDPRLAMQKVHSVLNSEDFYRDLSGAGLTEEVASAYRSLGQKLDRIMRMPVLMIRGCYIV